MKESSATNLKALTNIKSRLIFLRNIHLIRTLKNIAYVSIQPKNEEYRRYFILNAKLSVKYYFTDNPHSDILDNVIFPNDNFKIIMQSIH